MIADLLLCEQLRVKGWELQEIADHLKTIRPYSLTAVTICTDLKKSEKLWREQTIETRQRAKERLLREVNLVRKRAWEMLDKSAQDQVKTRAEMNGATVEKAAKSQPVKLTRENMAQYGDPGLLKVILECNRREAEIMGLDELTSFKISSADGDVAPALATESKVILYLPKKREAIDVDEIKKEHGKAT